MCRLSSCRKLRLGPESKGIQLQLRLSAGRINREKTDGILREPSVFDCFGHMGEADSVMER